MAIDLNTYGIIELATLGYLICTIKRKGVVQCCQFSSGVDPAICKRGVPTYDKKGGPTISPNSKDCQKGVALQTCEFPFHHHPRVESATVYCCSTELEKCLLKFSCNLYWTVQ